MENLGPSIDPDEEDQIRIYSRRESVNDEATVDRLVTENIRLAKFFAHKAADIDYDEAFSRAMQGLHRAAELFDTANGAPFGAFAACCIRSAIHRVRLGRNAIKRGRGTITFSMDAPISDENDSSIANTIPDPNADPLKHVDDDTNQDLINEALTHLDPKQREIICRRFGLNGESETFRSISESFGTSKQRIQQLETEALENLQRIVRGIRNRRELAETIEGAKEELKALKKKRHFYTPHLLRRRRTAIIRGSLFQIRLRQDGQAFALAA